jgi:hypothetical protein
MPPGLAVGCYSAASRLGRWLVEWIADDMLVSVIPVERDPASGLLHNEIAKSSVALLLALMLTTDSVTPE